MTNKMPLPTDVSIITTYRCQMRCQMCNIWKYPTDAKKEIQPKELDILPKLKFINLTGGEPFQRQDIEDIVTVCFEKSPRVVISTSGYHYDKIINLAKKFPGIGIRISMEGLSQKNDELRGRPGGFDKGIRTLLTLREMGVKDIGFGCTVSNNNSADMLALYQLSKALKMEFATAAFHNSYYFHKYDNAIANKEEVCNNFAKLIEQLLQEKHPKSWFRAFFNLGLINYIQDGKRLLPCEAGSTNIFIDPYGEVYPCNGLEKQIWKESMGNIRNYSDFGDLWNSEQAGKIREMVRSCPKNCWMVGTAAPVMKKYITHTTQWVVKNKVRSVMGKPVCIDQMPYYNVGQDSRQGDMDFSRCIPNLLEEEKEDLPSIEE